MWFLAALAVTAAGPAPDPAVYRCAVYTTGTDQRDRPAAFQRCVRDVIAKLGADPALLDAPLLPAGRAATMIDSFAYLDRMTDQPTHDEQGTRDRPFILVALVRPDAAADMLAAMGHPAWTTPRPILSVEATVQRGPDQFRVTDDGDRGERQRQAALAAGERSAIRIVLPPQGSPALLGSLAGALIWSEADFGWNADWTCGTRSWSIRSVSFDEAFRAAVGGAVAALANSPSTPH